MVASIKHILFVLLASFVLLLGLQSVMPLASYAQSAEQSICEGAGGVFNAGAGTCDAGDDQGDEDPFESGVFANITSLLSFIIGAVSVLMIIIGGFRYVLSQGDAQATQNAKNTILYAIVGVIIAFSAWGIANFVFDRVAAPAATATIENPATDDRAPIGGGATFEGQR